MLHKILTYAGKLFRNRNFILVLAVALGLAAGKQVAIKAEPLVLPLLALVMCISAMEVTSRELVSLRTIHRPVVYSLLLNYVILGGTILLLAWWLIPDKEIWTGFVLLAAVPPAPAVLPFTYSLGGDTRFSIIGMIGAYLAALVILPATIVLFLGLDFFNPWKILLILVELILIPIVVSRILLFTGVARYIRPYRGVIVNWSFFVIVFALIGSNRQAFFGEYDMLLRIVIIAIIISFLLSYVLELIGKALKLRHEMTVSVILMGTLKNYVLAGGILLALFTDRSTIPVSVCLVFGIFTFVWLGFHLGKRVQKPAI
jgi:bile acid:Na+ symporter, BASS family